jgi:hypothetical protein
MPDLVLPMHGDEWQNWGNQLLTEHYGPTNYVKIPDTEGDGGLEGFTRKEGIAFQCYGAEPGKKAKQLYEAQRDKMTIDINKFINNRSLLAKLLGFTKITCWTLFVPSASLKDLIAHTNLKTQEVLDANLPYVASGFYVTVCDEEHFASERDRLLAYKSDAICIETETPDQTTVDNWATTNDGLVRTLNEKLRKLSTCPTEKARTKFRHDILIWHVEGQNLLELLRSRSNMAYELVVKTKGQFEKRLSSIQMSTPESANVFQQTLSDFLATLQDVVKSLSKMNAMSLAHEAVADWLLRCPLDFPNGESHE